LDEEIVETKGLNRCGELISFGHHACTPSRGKIALTALALSGAWILGGRALHAAPITFNFEGRVTNVSDPWGWAGEVGVGDFVGGSYTFESTTPDAYPDDPSRGEYRNALIDFRFSIAESSFAMRPELSTDVSVHDAMIPFDLDGYGVGCTVAGPFGGRADFGLSLSASSSDVLNSDALLLIPPDVADFEALHLAGFSSEDLGLSVGFEVTVITPEMGTLSCTLGGIGLVLLVFRRRRIHQFVLRALVLLIPLVGNRLMAQVQFREETPTSGVPSEPDPISLQGATCGCTDIACSWMSRSA
jgi:hypothetical protein